jgi:hypothetical protein
MYVQIAPLHADVSAGTAAVFTVTVANPTAIIEGYRVQVFGLDRQHVTVTPERLAVFPDETGTAELFITLPDDFPAGMRSFTVQVQSETDPENFQLVQLSLNVASIPNVILRVDPASVTGGKRATYSLIVHNVGNTAVRAVPDGIDPEEKATISFLPGEVSLGPGRREVIEAQVYSKRPWVGSPKPHMFTFAVDTPTRIETVASFIQKPRIGRMLIALMGLILAAGVFAIVLSKAFNSVVDEASVDPKMLDEALANEDENRAEQAVVSVDPETIAGKVVLVTDQSVGVPGVQAALFNDGNTVLPVATAATAKDGSFAFTKLDENGKYLLRFTGAGFNDTWYPKEATPAGAQVLSPGTAPNPLPPVALAGQPGSVRGKVITDDVGGVTATLRVTGQIEPELTPAVVQQVQAGADGSFVFENLPSPSDYELIIEKPGLVTATMAIPLGPGENVEGLEIPLREGDGEISGMVTDGSIPLGAVTVTASDGTNTIETVTLTSGEVGTFILHELPAPAVYSVTVTREGYRSESRSITLGPSDSDTHEVSGVDFVLAPSVGSIAGTVTTSDGAPLGGVEVQVTGGGFEAKTTTISQGTGTGTYEFTNLPAPITYTVSFTKEGYIPQVRLEDVDTLDGTATKTGIDAAMSIAAVAVRGSVKDVAGNLLPRADVVLTNGDETRTLQTADQPAGQFEFSNVEPGAYTLTASLKGTNPSVVLVNVVAAQQVAPLELRLEAQASLSGVVHRIPAANPIEEAFPGAVVRLYRPGDFPLGNPMRETVTDAAGQYAFTELAAPDDLVVAVFLSSLSADAVGSQLVSTIPSQNVTVPTFVIPV